MNFVLGFNDVSTPSWLEIGSGGEYFPTLIQALNKFLPIQIMPVAFCFLHFTQSVWAVLCSLCAITELEMQGSEQE